MKMCNLLRGCALIAVVAAVTAWAAPAEAQTGVQNSVHDLNVYVPAITMPDSRICVACHTPHNAQASTDAPLWNHAASAGGHTPYVGQDMQATVGAPTGVSLLCLSCHDGSVALDSFGAGTRTDNTPGTTTLTGTALFDLDLTNDHPVSFTYDTALSTDDGELEDPAVVLSGLPGGGTISDDMLFGASNDQVECASCHDVHNGPNVPVGSALLLKDNTASALCTTCHQK